jgi:hypothetical protein
MVVGHDPLGSRTGFSAGSGTGIGSSGCDAVPSDACAVAPVAGGGFADGAVVAGSASGAASVPELVLPPVTADFA